MVDIINKHHRRSIRLPGVDYSVPGFYFVTVCAKNREHLFGEVTDSEARLNEFGKIIREEWARTSEIRKNVVIDEFIVMPNHLHGILLITESPDGLVRRGVLQYAPTPIGEFRSPSQTVGAITRGFKGTTTKRINILRGFEEGGSVWQRNYFEHIIRDSKSLERIRQYIRSNPFNWQMDLDNIATQHKWMEKEYEKKTREHYGELFK